MSVTEMKFTRRASLARLFGALLCSLVAYSASAQTDPLPSWNDSSAKTGRESDERSISYCWKAIYPFEKQ